MNLDYLGEDKDYYMRVIEYDKAHRRKHAFKLTISCIVGVSIWLALLIAMIVLLEKWGMPSYEEAEANNTFLYILYNILLVAAAYLAARVGAIIYHGDLKAKL